MSDIPVTTKESVSAVLACALFACACSSDASLGLPAVVFGEAEPVLGGVVTLRISKEFSRFQARAFYDALESSEFQAELEKFSCGDALPKFAYTVSVWEAAPYQQRHVQVQETPSLGREQRNQCLAAGIRFLASVELAKIDEGVEITMTEFDKKTGREVVTSIREKQLRTKPWCDCARRDSGQEWVQYPSAVSMTPNNSLERTAGLRPSAARLMIR